MQDFITRTHNAGARFENLIVKQLSKFTNVICQNVRVETLLVLGGCTEIDILCTFHDTIYVLELKHVQKIEAYYGSINWRLYSGGFGSQEMRRYSAPSVLVQNGIHAKSVADVFYSYYHYYPKIHTSILVPDGCEVPTELQNEILHVSEFFNRFLLNVKSSKSFISDSDRTLSVRVMYLFGGNKLLVKRKDFIVDNKSRIKNTNTKIIPQRIKATSKKNIGTQMNNITLREAVNQYHLWNRAKSFSSPIEKEQFKSDIFFVSKLKLE